VPYVVDANVMNHFQDERINDIDGDAHKALDAIFAKSCVALDEQGLCLQEWLDCASGAAPLALQDWVSDMLVAQKIRLFVFSGGNLCKELTGIGLPKKDHKWVRLAVSSDSDAIVTEDVDLFDPSKKGQSAAITQAIKQSCKGPVSKFLKKKFGIHVMFCSHVPGHAAVSD
jgi:hypothetical protein